MSTLRIGIGDSTHTLQVLCYIESISHIKLLTRGRISRQEVNSRGKGLKLTVNTCGVGSKWLRQSYNHIPFPIDTDTHLLTHSQVLSCQKWLGGALHSSTLPTTDYYTKSVGIHFAPGGFESKWVQSSNSLSAEHAQYLICGLRNFQDKKNTSTQVRLYPRLKPQAWFAGYPVFK